MRSGFVSVAVGVAVLCLSSLVPAQEPAIQIPGAQFDRPTADSATAVFEFTTVPPGPLFLYLKLRAQAGDSGALSLDIRVNGVLIFRGPAALSPNFWRFKRLPVPAGSLRTGANRLEVSAPGAATPGPTSSVFEVGEADLADLHFAATLDAMTDFEVDLPAKPEPYPTPLGGPEKEPPFKIRGTKGWAWTPEQYLAEIPYLVKARMNFLMNCYTSMFSSLNPFINRWWEPLPEAKKKVFEEVVRTCQKNGIQFCFAMHPQLFSERPLALDSAEDFERLWQHYAWMQSLGVTWFSVSYDDIGVEGQDKSRLGEAQARLVNKLLSRLRKKTPQAQLIFCPVYYMGCGDSLDAQAYFSGLSRVLDPNVFVFWTGDGVVSPRVTMKCAAIYRKAVGHRLFLWDNYPVNDRNPTLHLGPVTGRDTNLSELIYGYMGNPLCPQNDINRIPLFTSADYAFNPAGYDPLRSIGQAIAHLADTPGQRQALKELVELYPGMLLYGNTGTGFNPVLERFRGLIQRPETRGLAVDFLSRVERAEKQLAASFPDKYLSTRETVRGHVAEMRQELASKK